jgi:hypothetical protein
MDHINMMNLHPQYMGRLRNQFSLLAFLTDEEITKLMSMVQTVSLALGVDPADILNNMSKQAESTFAKC